MCSADFIAFASTSHFPFFVLQRPCIEKSILQKVPKIPSNVSLVQSQAVHEQVVEVKVAEQVFDKRCCRVSVEDELAEHGIRHAGHVGTGGGKRRGVQNTRR